MGKSSFLFLREFLISQTAARLGIDNTPTPVHRANLMLVALALEEIRAEFGPVIISSGYRSAALNARVPGSSKTSAHCSGMAADFHIPGVANYDVACWIRDNKTVDQVIYEFGPYPAGWVHLGLSVNPRRQALTAIRENGRTAYKPGILKI